VTARVSSGERREAEGKIGLIGMMAFVLVTSGVLLFFLALLFWPRRCSTLDANALGCCRAYCMAQAVYKGMDWNNNDKWEYARPFPLLHDQGMSNGDTLRLIDADFAAATSPDKAKHGYYFGDMATIEGKPIDPEKDFAFCATPAVYGKTGYRTFIVCTNGTTFGKDLGRSELVDDYPADPCADGWIIAE